MLTEKTKQAIFDLQKKYPEKRSALIPALHLAQNEIGYLPAEIQMEVAELFDIHLNEVNSVVTFYDMFYEKPMGKHIVHVCKNISCMLRGADELTRSICQKVKCNLGETSEDGQYSVIAAECLGACDRAPMMLLDEQVIGPIKESDLNQIFQKA